MSKDHQFRNLPPQCHKHTPAFYQPKGDRHFDICADQPNKHKGWRALNGTHTHTHTHQQGKALYSTLLRMANHN